MNDYNNDIGRELDWDDAIEKEDSPFVVLPVGEYPFSVSKMERARYTPKDGAKLPPCNMAVVFLTFDGGDKGTCTVEHKLFLYTTMEWRLTQFFTAIGQRKHGERIVPNWAGVPGSFGRAKLKVRHYKTKDGEDRSINEVECFLDPAPNAVSPATMVTAPKTFEPGRF